MNQQLIIKIGGSLFSDKAAKRDIDLLVVSKFARLIAALAREAPGRISVVLGGGAFGHGAVRAADPHDPFSLVGLTEANFELKSIWTSALRRAGARAIPLQLMAICEVDGDKAVLECGVLRRCFQTLTIPVLTGDCVLSSDGSLQVVGSDRVPDLIASCIAGSIRAVFLTDTAGVLEQPGLTTVPWLDADRPDEVLARVWPAGPADTTGGMRGKLDAVIPLARRGVECIIMRGECDADSISFLLDPIDRWPARVAFSRIGVPSVGIRQQ